MRRHTLNGDLLDRRHAVSRPDFQKLDVARCELLIAISFDEYDRVGVVQCRLEQRMSELVAERNDVSTAKQHV